MGEPVNSQVGRVPSVLLLGPYPPPWGGVQTNLVSLRDFLRKRAIPCTVINLTRHRRAPDDGVYYPSSGAEVVRLLLRLRHDVIHLHIGGDLSPRLLMLALFCTMLPWASVVLTFHSGGYPRSPRGQRARPFSLGGFVLRRLDRQIAVNRELAQLFERFGCSPQHVRIIAPHALSDGMRERIRTAELPLAVKQFAAAHSPLLVTLSGLEPEYDLPVQVEALGTLRRTHANAGLVIIGSGSMEAAIREGIAEAPHGEHVLLAGDLAREVALRVLSTADVFLRTTLYDGDAISVREALWLGVPSIATDNGMRPPGVVLVPVHDAPTLANTIARVLASPRQVESPQDTGEENLERTLALYLETLDRDSRASGSLGRRDLLSLRR